MERIDLNKNSHPQSLERLCAAALSAGDFEAAFMYADRRCRIQPFAKPHHYTMRAEALVRLGDKESAVADIEAALALAPEDIPANRRMLAWGDTAQQIAAARALVSADDDAAILTRALDVLRDSGCDAIASARTLDDTVTGWAAWNGEDSPKLSLEGGGSRQAATPVADRSHPLAGSAFDHVAGFSLARDRSPTGHRLTVTRGRERIFTMQMPANGDKPIARRAPQPRAAAHAAGISVIVPIYRDLAATRVCLDSLEPEISGKAKRRAILVNDATPEPKLAKYLKTFAAKPGFTLLTNEHNLGFVGSVNRALAEADDDIVLLNADTIVPPGCFDRLAEIAHSDMAIGTITPLSNNGEFTSFPVAFEQNPLPSQATVNEIDKIAADVNRGRVVDMPNGIGFCMFISRGCLDAVGPLSQSYQRGYLEDVDFCLRARERGFRNVCAPSIFVGHHGSRSFGGDKRALVVRNIAVAETKFPDYRQECALFMSADPLRPARDAIERRMNPETRYDRVIISGGGLVHDVAEWRAEKFSRDGLQTLLLCVSASRTHVELRDAGGAAPQSLRLGITESADFVELRDHLAHLDIGLVEILDPAAMPSGLIDLVERLGLPLKVVPADAGAICPRGSLMQPDGSFCSTLGSGEACRTCAETFRADAWRGKWKVLSGGRPEPPCAEAEEFAANLFSASALPVFAPTTTPAAKTDRAGATRMGLVVQGRTVDEFSLIQGLLRATVQRCPEQAFVVVGSTFNDLALIASGNAFVSGGVKPGDHATVLRQYGIGKIFLPLRRPLFGHPAFEAAHDSDLPLAYFDWSFGGREVRTGDLAIDPRCGVPDIVAALGAWGGF